jgi:hypothetical protein
MNSSLTAIICKLCLMALLCSIWFGAFAQTLIEDRDITDVINQWKGDTSMAQRPELQVGKNYLSLLPVIGYAPANGFVAGGAISITRLMAPSPTRLSTGMLNCQVTSKQQFIVNARSKVYLKNNRWFLQGDWRLLFFSQPTYGLGINNAGGNSYLVTINELPLNTPPKAEPMRFNYVRIYQDVVRQIGNTSLYAGFGIAFENHFNIRDEKLNTDSSSEQFFITNHYAYSVLNKLDPTQYFTTGFNLNLLSDTRDVIANPYSGHYAALTLRFNPKIFKSARNSVQLNYDLRYYRGLSDTKDRQVISFWTWGSFILDGEVPYLALPSVGWDTYNRSGRGYVQGRYRGLNVVYVEAEYRFPLSDNGMWGGVAFLNSTFASGYELNLFEKGAPGLGVGLRMKMDKRARVNLTVDYGLGLDRSHGLYFSMQETF